MESHAVKVFIESEYVADGYLVDVDTFLRKVASPYHAPNKFVLATNGNNGGKCVMVVEAIDFVISELGRDAAGEQPNEWRHISIVDDKTGIREAIAHATMGKETSYVEVEHAVKLAIESMGFGAHDSDNIVAEVMVVMSKCYDREVHAF